MVGTIVKVLPPLHSHLTFLSSGQILSGAVYGFQAGGVRVRLEVWAAGQQQVVGDKGRRELLNEMLPWGIEPMGVFGLGDQVKDLVPLLQQLLPLSQPSETPFVYWGGGHSGQTV